jgi:fermentation-respiration switch protein FrsA (DUF1100 family)
MTPGRTFKMSVTLLIPIAVIVVLLLAFWAGQRRLMYFPLGDVPAIAALGLSGVEEVAFDTADGLHISGWLFTVDDADRASAVIVFHGNAGNRAHRIPLAIALRRIGLQVLLFDYRGYGGNPGSPTEQGLEMDARAAREFLINQRGVEPGRLIYFGESLGTGVAVKLATEHPPAALILRSPYTSMADIGQHHYPWLPVRLLLRDRYDSLTQISRVKAPLLIIAGERDSIVPADFSRRLYDMAPQPKTFVSIPGADHNDDELLDGRMVLEAIAKFLGANGT